MFGFEFMHSRNPEQMFLLISNAIDNREKRQSFDRLGRRLARLVLGKGGTPRYSLGISMRVMDSEVVIQQVVAGSGAEKAGLKIGDQLTSVNGKPLGSKPMEVLGALLQDGSPIQFDIRRDGKRQSLTVVPTRKNE